MASAADCISQLVTAARAMGRELSDEETQAIFERVHAAGGDAGAAARQLVREAEQHHDAITKAIVLADMAAPGLRTAAAKQKPSELLRDIMDLGGISKREMSDIPGESTSRAQKGIPPRLFRDAEEGGRELDDLAISLRERGWNIPEGDDINALTDLIQGEFEGKRAERMGEEGKGAEAEAKTTEDVARKYADLEMAAAEKYDFNPRDSAYQAEIKALTVARDLELARVMGENGDRTGAAARRFVAENGDLVIKVAEPDGNVKEISLQQFVDDAQAEADRLRRQKDVSEIAADCYAGMQ